MTTHRKPAMHALVLRSPHAHAKFTIDVSPRPRPARGRRDPDRRGRQGSRRAAVPVQSRSRSVHRPSLSDPGRTAWCAMSATPSPSWSPIRVDQARDAIEAIEVEWTPLPAAIGVANAVKKGAPQVWPDHPGNVLFDVPIGDKKATEAAFAKAHAVAEDLGGQSARHHQLHGNPRGGLRIRRQARSSDADGRQPGQSSVARNHRRDGAEDPAGKNAGDLPGCRRRVRHQAVSLPRIRADRGRRAKTAQDRQVDRRSLRSFHGRRARARQRHHGADGARRRRQVPRAWTST